jgi:iron complex transport system substrate-binding protein
MARPLSVLNPDPKPWRAAGLAAVAILFLTGFASKPQRVMSMSQCTDQLVLSLLPLERISSVSYRAAGGAVSPEVLRKARLARVNHGLAEEVLAQKPDLLLTAPYTSIQTRRLAERAGVRVIEVGVADSFDDIRRITRQVAEAVGEPERGEVLLGRMDATLAQLDRTAPSRKLRAIGWNGDGRIPGEHSLFNTILTAAGGINLAAGPGDFRTSFDLEQILAIEPRPDLLLYGQATVTAPGLQTGMVQHPALARAFAHRRIAYPEGVYECGAPQAADEALALRRQMLDVLDQAGVRP